jgi:hypothetical protein
MTDYDWAMGRFGRPTYWLSIKSNLLRLKMA